MVMSNRERIRKGLDELKAGLIPFIEREFKAKLGAHWAKELTDRAPDHRELESLLQATAQYLAWASILTDRMALNLDAFQESQAKSKAADFDRTIDLRIGAAWTWALVPIQLDPAGEIPWEAVRVTGNDSLAKRTSAKLIAEEMLLPKVGGVRLRMTLDRYLWADRDHVTVGELCDWLPRYLYLPRVKDRDTILEAVRDGASVLIADDTFATVEDYDGATGRYLGLRIGGGSPASIDNHTCLVKPNVARRQQAEDEKQYKPPEAGHGSIGDGKPLTEELHVATGAGITIPSAPSPPVKPTTFVASVQLDGTRVGRDAGRIADEVLSHLASLPGAEVEVTLEIHIWVPEGVDHDIVRTVRENASVLGFRHTAFEND
jgi:hypothetical protein